MEHTLLQKVERFLKEADMPPSVFGRRAVCDPRLVDDLRAGRQPGTRIICRLEHFMNMWRVDYRAGRTRPIGDRRTRRARLLMGVAA